MLLPHPARLAALLTCLAACGGQGSTTAGGVASSPPPDTSAFPLAPAFNAADYRAAVADDSRALALVETRPDQVPLGRATYDGHVRSGVRLDGEGGYDIIGDLRMVIDMTTRQPIAGRNPVTGSITDLTLIDRFSGDRAEAFAGRLDIDGDVTLAEIEADAVGTLALDRFNSRIDDESRVRLTLDGSLRDDFGRGDVATGVVGGGSTSDPRNDYDLTLDGNGRFYAAD